MADEDGDEEFDKLDHIINSSGCAKELELSKGKGFATIIDLYIVTWNLECFFEKKDWRLCTATTEALKKCMEAQQTERRRKHNLSK